MKRTISIQPGNNLPYILAVVAMSGLGVVGVVAVSVFNPHQDNSIVISHIIGFLAPTTVSILAFMKSQETHIAVNSRMDKFIRDQLEANNQIHRLRNSGGVKSGKNKSR